MRQLFLFITLSVLLTSCGDKQEKVSTNSSPTPTATKEAETTNVATPTPASSPTTKATERPIDFTYLGIKPDKQHIGYRIKVNTEKPISQVDLGFKFTDAGGKVLEETTFLWQNIVHSKRMPIEKGQTYNVEDYLPEGTTKAEVVLKRVVFEDGTYWNAQ